MFLQPFLFQYQEIDKFPLLKLPYLAQQHVLRVMDNCDQITASFCSRRFLKRLQSLKLKAPEFHIEFRGGIKIELGLPSITHFTFSHCLSGGLIANQDYTELETWSQPPSFSANQWILHLKSIYNSKGISLSFQNGCGNQSIEDIKRTLEGLEIVSLTVRGGNIPNVYYQQILEEFQPSDSLDIARNPFSDREMYLKLINRPYKELNLHSTTNTRIEDLTMLTCSVLNLWSTEMREDDVNRLLTSWKNGWNPTLHRMTIHFMSSGDPDYHWLMMSGLNFEKVLRSNYHYGYKVMNGNGNEATIHFMIIGTWTIATLKVWNHRPCPFFAIY